MHKRLIYISVFFLLIIGNLQLLAQEERSDNLPVDRPRIFRLVFTRGFMIASQGAETPGVPLISAGSGSYFLGASFQTNFLHGRWGFRAQPGFNWLILTYEQTNSKVFPPSPLDSISLDIERHRITYLEMPLGVFVNFTKDEDGDGRFFLEGGGYLGYRIGGAYKFKYDDEQNNTVKQVTRGLDYFKDFRYGLYSRIGYKWFSLYFSYRFSDVFSDSVLGLYGPLDEFPFPEIPRVELGLTLLW